MGILWNYNNRNNIIDLQFHIIDISNLDNRLINDISRNSIIEEFYNNHSNPNFLLNFLQNNINIILQNTLHDNSDSPFIQNFINNTFESDNKKKFKRVTHDDEIKKLKVQKFNKNNTYTNYECPINLTKFEENDEIIILPCNHIYNAESIYKWLNEESNCCPICRFELN